MYKNKELYEVQKVGTITKMKIPTMNKVKSEETWTIHKMMQCYFIVGTSIILQKVLTTKSALRTNKKHFSELNCAAEIMGHWQTQHTPLVDF